jgi:tetratricopeptide (TPR) repeat protein
MPSAAAPKRVLTFGTILAAGIMVAHLTSFRGTFVLDDFKGILENPTLTDLRRLGLILNPGDMGGATVGGRPLLNLSFALNRALGGFDPWGYHAINLAIHVSAAWLLFGLVRRTLALVPGARRVDPTLAAFAVAAVWALHPLQTGAVTYIIQRAESLCGMFYLLTLYGFVRSCGESGGQRFWQVTTILACLAGMATKEVMATAPVVILLYDRTFLAGSFAAAWKQRGRFHLALAATWLLLVILMLGTGNRGGTAGFGSGITPWQYALTQAHAIGHYLRLAFWPQPLVFDYGTPLYGLTEVLPSAALLLGLLAATGWALVRRPVWGFFGAVFFLVLAPSSSVVPVATQTIAEHRMYLPLAAVATGVGAWLLAAWGRAALAGLLAAALLLGTLTARRNLVYASEFSLWEDTVAHAPNNPRARTNFGIALAGAERWAEAEAQFREALPLAPNDAAVPANLCNVLGQQGRFREAFEFGESAVKLDPLSVPGRVNLAFTLEQLGRPEEAIPHYEEALKLAPDTPNIAPRLAALLTGAGNRAATAGNFAEAIQQYRRALAVSPENIPARANLGNALLVSGRVGDAITEYREVLRRDPGNRRVQENLARALESSR